MNPFQNVTQPGVFQLMVPAAMGMLEVEVTVSSSPCWDKVAILGHPHSLHGGSMQNKVVSTLLRAYKDLHIPVIRFNFRGVGKSQGVYDSGIGESQDMFMLANNWLALFPNVRFYFAGFSFGSFVAYRTAALAVRQSWPVQHLITVAPSVQHYNYNELPFDPKQWFIIQGEEDEVVVVDTVYDFAAKKQPPIAVIRIQQATHFFHGKLIELKNHVLKIIQE